jgi:hypothetical protein
LSGRQFQAARPGLILRVHVVVLNLAKTPQIAAVDDLLEGLVLVVKGEAEMPDAPVGQRGLGPASRSCFRTISCQRLVTQRVQQVKVDMVGLQLF